MCLKILLCAAAVITVSSGVFAGSLDLLSNRSARNVMTLSRNGALDSADIVAYNPAGTVFLNEGFALDFSNQQLFKPYRQDLEMTGEGVPGMENCYDISRTSDQWQPTLFLPNLYLVYNFGKKGPVKLAVFGELGAVGGGGTLKWNGGTAGTNVAMNGIIIGLRQRAGMNLGTVASQKFTGKSAYYSGALGVSCALPGEKISVSLGARGVWAQRSFSMSSTVNNTAEDTHTVLTAKFEYEAKGVTPIFGINFRPDNRMVISARYEMETSMEFKYKQKTLSADGNKPGYAFALSEAAKKFLNDEADIKDGRKFHQNLPHIIALGFGYDVTEKTNVVLSGTLYMMKEAAMGRTEKYFNNGWEVALGATHKLLDNLKAGAGVMYTESGAKTSFFENTRTGLNASANPTLDSVSFGIGGTYTFDSGIDLTLSGLYVHYIPFKYDFSCGVGPEKDYTLYASGEYCKDVLALAFGIGYKM